MTRFLQFSTRIIYFYYTVLKSCRETSIILAMPNTCTLTAILVDSETCTYPKNMFVCSYYAISGFRWKGIKRAGYLDVPCMQLVILKNKTLSYTIHVRMTVLNLFLLGTMGTP